MREGLTLINLALMGGCILSAQSGNYGLATALSAGGIATSSSLLALTKPRSERLIEQAQTIAELTATIDKLKSEMEWQQALIEGSEAKQQQLLADKERDFESEKQALTTQILELQQHQTDLSNLETKLIEFQAELKHREKALALEEKRIRLDVRDERGQTKELLRVAQEELKTLTVLSQHQQATISQLRDENQRLYSEMYASSKGDELLATIQSTLATNGIETEYVERTVRGDVEVLTLRPKGYFDTSKLPAVAGALPGLVDIPQPTITPRKGYLEVRIDRRNPLDRINDAPKDWLTRLYLDGKEQGKNLAIFGARGGGKSELAKNYCAIAVSHEPDSEIIYIQPKIDDYATFEVGGKHFEPDYIGFESITNRAGAILPSAYDGILYLRQLYNERNAAKQEAFANGDPMPNFPRAFFLIDEFQLLVSREREFLKTDLLKSESLKAGQSFCGKVVRDAISLGRSLGITALVLGQLPNVSVYGWLKSDLYQYNTIFMAANVGQAAELYAPTKEEKARIQAELELWRERGGFYGYIRPMDKPGYLALFPPPLNHHNGV